MDIYYSEVLNQIEELIKKQDKVIIGIDGTCASGKTTLANELKERFSGEVIHLDDFFLRPTQRTSKRLSEIGGFVDYERFNTEITEPLINNEPVIYHKYDCKAKELSDDIEVSNKQLIIIEGSYSHNPKVYNEYDVKIVLKTTYNIQIDRITKRNGSKMLERFINEWIPRENEYIKEFKIIELSDFVFET